MQVTKIINFSAAHRLTDYNGSCRYLHGHNYRLEVTVKKHRDSINNGMVCDFKDVKRMLNIVTGYYDHAIIISCKDDELTKLVTNLKEYKAHYIDGNTTAENMIQDFRNLFEGYIVSEGLNIIVTRIKLYETETSFAEWEIGKNGI